MWCSMARPPVVQPGEAACSMARLHAAWRGCIHGIQPRHAAPLRLTRQAPILPGVHPCPVPARSCQARSPSIPARSPSLRLARCLFPRWPPDRAYHIKAESRRGAGSGTAGRSSRGAAVWQLTRAGAGRAWTCSRAGRPALIPFPGGRHAAGHARSIRTQHPLPVSRSIRAQHPHKMPVSRAALDAPPRAERASKPNALDAPPRAERARGG